ncbi:DUF2795 domain-containing protein [Polymorphospora rubra]|uniref:DUF2795 domain-containing protein n=1 Tax=Polymorphospora rubra TaxID=338584 RepID=UPI0033F0F16E
MSERMAGQEFADVRAILDDLDFPATKEQIVAHGEARDRGSGEVVRLLRALPLGTYDNISQIRSSVPLDPAADDGLGAGDEMRKARSPHDQRVAQNLRSPDA